MGWCGQTSSVTEVLSDQVKTFGDLRVRMRFVVSQELPERANSTTGIGFIFDDDNRLLLVKSRKYGWSPPGGHIEPTETPEQAMRREVAEEASVTVGPASFFGYEELRVLNDPVPETYRYPVPSYQCFFVGLCHEAAVFESNTECEAIGFFGPGSDILEEWIQREASPAMMQLARARAAELRKPPSGAAT
jgi:8-oxo-dGTP diphosphatase